MASPGLSSSRLASFTFEPNEPGFTCVVAEGTAIYVSVNARRSTVEPPPFFGRDEDELRACTPR